MSTTYNLSPYLGPGHMWNFKVAGGISVPIESVPFQGYLSRTDTNQVFCGATIISSLAILTAAHCLVGKNASSLAFTAGNIRTTSLAGTAQKRGITSFHIHEDYRKVPNSHEHDIAVAFLSSPLKVTEQVKIIGDQSYPSAYIGNATVSGWGRLHHLGEGSEVVRAAVVPLVSQSECSRMWPGITENFICAYKPGVSTCRGDSGGALSGYVNGELIVVGVVSFGTLVCGNINGYPKVYVNVSQYGSWIRLKILAASSAANCPSGHVACSPFSSKCIKKSWLCDGDNDCGNNEDEANCSMHKKRGTCNPNQVWCPSTSKCITNTWVCDGDNDCGNNDDEINCKLFGKPSQCDRNQFWCKGTSKCITIDWVCDGDNDCGNNEDEKFCKFH